CHSDCKEEPFPQPPICRCHSDCREEPLPQPHNLPPSFRLQGGTSSPTPQFAAVIPTAGRNLFPNPPICRCHSDCKEEPQTSTTSPGNVHTAFCATLFPLASLR